MVLPTVLVFVLLLGLLVRGALQLSALEVRNAALRGDSMEARAYAEAVLDLLVRRAVERWPDGGVNCPEDRYCQADFPAVRSLVDQAPAVWAMTPSLVPPAETYVFRDPAGLASSARRYRLVGLEARVELAGPTPMSLVQGFALPVDAP